MAANPSTLLGGAALIAAAAFGAAHMVSIEREQRDILKQLQEIKALLQSRPAAPAAQAARPGPAALPANLTLSLDGAAIRGKPDARLAIVEFSDFECPFCGRYSRETFERVSREYMDSGKVRYAFRNYPLVNLHPHAMKASQAAMCAAEQGKFWEMHKRLFANQQKLGDADLRETAAALGINLPVYDRCVASDAVSVRIRKDQDEGARAGVTGTPFFFVGTLQSDGTLKVVRRLSGAQPYDSFKSVLDSMLSSSSPAS